MLRVVRVQIGGLSLFKNDLIVDFFNSDSVRKMETDNEFTLNVFKVKSGLYSQVLMAFTGLNATGKTTVLELLSVIMQIVILGKTLNDSLIQQTLFKLIPLLKENKIDWKIYFIQNDIFYMLHSIISENKIHEKNISDTGFVYTTEELYSRKLAKVTRKNLFEFSEEDNVVKRTEELDNPYLKDDISIVTSVKGIKGVVRPLSNDTNINVPVWLGVPSSEAIHVFDPNVEQLKIYNTKEGNPQSELSFKNRANLKYSGSPLGLVNLLSSGTIKGLSILPAIIKALEMGGYVFLDEIENHFNKKIIEWFFNLFTDKRTNPNGACLIFSTHYPELLDFFARKDNIFITRRDTDNYCECVKYSDFIARNELSKSRVLLENAIGGTAPRFQDLENGRKWIQSIVTKEGA